MKLFHLALAAATFALASGAYAQTGADSCTTPDVLVGTGVFNFDNTLATTGTEGQTEAICNQLASSAILTDVWFTWTATSSGTVLIQTCNITGVDTKIALYAGNTCPTAGTSLACNDDNCSVGFQSSLSAPVTAGNSYVIQLGLYPGTAPVATPGAGQFSIGLIQSLGFSDGCGTAVPIAGPGSYLVSNQGATTGTEGQTESACLAFTFTAVINDIWFTYTPTTNGTVTIATCGASPVSVNEDSKIAVYAGSGCPTPGSAIACNDDNGCATFGFESSVSFTATCGTTYLIQFGMYGGSFATDLYSGGVDITEVGGSPCTPPFTSFCLGDGTGLACPCANSGAAGNGCANSLNANGGNLTASGSASVSGDTWVLAGSGIPNGPGLYYQAVNQLGGGNGVVFGDGIRCIGGSVIRLGIVTAAGNASTYPTGVTPPNSVPISVKGFNLAGDVRNYQLWYRDSAIGFCSASVFNLTNALNVTWQP